MIPTKTAPNFIVIDREEWPRTPDGEFAMFTRPLDLEACSAKPLIVPTLN